MCATPSPRTPWRGANIKAVSVANGHADSSTRLRTYAHVLPEQRREVGPPR
jgi:hypothetical protein